MRHTTKKTMTDIYPFLFLFFFFLFWCVCFCLCLFGFDFVTKRFDDYVASFLILVVCLQKIVKENRDIKIKEYTSQAVSFRVECRDP